MKNIIGCVFLATSLILPLCNGQAGKDIVIDERARVAVVAEELVLDKVWAGHPVGFFLMTEGKRQYFSYYNADRQMVVGMRLIGESDWVRFMPETDFTCPQNNRCPDSRLKATTRLWWDSHNYMTMAIDKEGYVHLSGNMHCNNLTYYRSTKPYDIKTLVQVKSMTGELEDRCTYPKFMKNAADELIFTYRHGSSGSGNQIYNIYDTEAKTWKRLLAQPLTDGKGVMNAYPQGPVLGDDGWYHMSWVWRDTYDCKTNHDLSYAKSPDLLNWFAISGKKLELPITIDTPGVIVDAIPVEGGIINGSGKIGFDGGSRVVLAYHKFDKNGNTQAYCARAVNGRWQIKKLTDWDYRWFFEGGGSIVFEVRLGNVVPRKDGYLELSYSHKKHGSGVWLLNNRLDIVGKVYKAQQIPSQLNKIQSDFPDMQIKRTWDVFGDEKSQTRYLLQWETLPQNRDLPREGQLPEPSELKLVKINTAIP